MIKKTALYLSLFLLSLLLFLIATLPINFIWQKAIAPQLKGQNLPVKVLALEGTVWAGKALIRYQRIEAIVDWNISPSGLFSLSLPVAAKIESQVGRIKLNANIGMSSADVELESVDIDLAHLTPLLKRQRVTLNGQFVAKDVHLEIIDKKLVSASGLFSWSGGDIAYPAGRQLHERSLPVFKGKLETKSNGDIYLGIRDSEAVFDIIEGSLDQNGSAMLKVTRRLLDVADEAWPQNSREQDVVFKVKKNIYR